MESQYYSRQQMEISVVLDPLQSQIALNDSIPLRSVYSLESGI